MKSVKVGDIQIGDGARISIQSMTNTPTSDTDRTIAQINALKNAGCDIVRIAVPDIESAQAVYDIKSQTDIPLVADIHFDYKLALMCIERGIDKIRINPGNIGSEDKIRQVAKAAQEKNIPIRIGVNGGSLEAEILEKYRCASPEAMVESAAKNIELLTKYDFDDIVVSLKSSDVITTINAYRLMRQRFDYPLHLGVTEAGTLNTAVIKSAIGIGSLLADGIGDTIRVSATADPVEEIPVAQAILKSLGLFPKGAEVISCPTCGRCKIDIISIAGEINKRTANIDKPIKIAVMGCVVNGPGEAKDADIGIAGGDGCAVLFKKGEIIRKIPEHDIVQTIMSEVEQHF